QKEGQLERLEKEKNLIGEELELTGGRIKELEGALRGADAKIAELEARIKELESKGDNSEQLERLKKELAAEKQKSQQARTKSQSEIKRLQNELQQTKKREEELAAKIKELGTKKVKVQEVVEKSFWETVKTPLFYGKEQARKESKAEQNKDELTDATAELVFIPVNQPNFHWSLLVYEAKTKTFYHYDTLRGCGVAILAIIRRIKEKYGGDMNNTELGGLDFAKEREKLREKYLQEINP
ncbi:16939_t:CDS:2, partial [Racocetra persica]